jgi:transcriptional regulator with XRE-family HTH domain
MSETIEERVRTVIDGSGMARAEFADAIGMDPTKLSKSLSGRRRFSSLELARVADVGRMSVDWLITGSAPFRPVFARRARAADVGDEAGARVVERLVTAVRGLAELDRPLALPELPQLAQRSSWYLVEAAQLAARYVDALGRCVAGLTMQELVAAIEREFGVIDELPDGIDGLSYEDADARVVVLAPTDRPLRQRFSLAHELAHIAFGDAEQGMLEERLWDVRSNAESRANAFAAAFLAPSEELRSVLGDRSAADVFPELVERFQLSPDAMAWRLFNEDLIDRTTCERLRGLTAKSIYLQLGKPADYFDLALAAGDPRPGWLLVNACVDAYRDGETTVKPVARLLGWTPEETLDGDEREAEPGLIEN